MPWSGIRFTPEIKLGQLVAAVVAVFSIGGYAGATYLEVERQFDSQTKVFDAVNMEISLLKQRLDQDEKSNVDHAQMQREHDGKVSQSLDKITDTLGNLAVLIAASGNHEPRR